MVVNIPHIDGGFFKAPGNPVKLDDHKDTWESPPKLGEHTDNVLKSLLGFSDKQLQTLRKTGSIG